MILRWWYALQRRIDLQILWPQCVRVAHDLDHAKGAFALHCFSDPAWRALGHDGIVHIIDNLDTPEEDIRHGQEP